MKKLISLILIFCLCLPFAVSCSRDEQEEASDTQPIITEKNVVLATGITAGYKIITPLNCSEELTSTVTSLVSKLQQITGAPFRMETDKSNSYIDSEGEIIIGSCKRNDTAKILDSTGYKDYQIAVTEKNIVIAAHTDEAAINAVFKFMSFLTDEFVSFDEGSKVTTLLWKQDYSFVHENYSIKSMSLNGNSLKDYTIIYPSLDMPEKNREYALELQMLIGNACGYVLPVADDSAQTSDLEILIGKTSRTETTACAQALGSLEFITTTVGNKLILLGNGAYTTKKAIESFDTNMRLVSENLEEIDISRSLVDGYEQNTKGDYRLMQYNVLVEFDGWGSGGKLTPSIDVRKEIVAATILGYSPDVLVLCEFFDQWREKLPPLIESQYEFVQADRADGVSNRTPIVYKKDKFQLIDSGYTDIEKANGLINRRVVTWAVLKDKTTGEQLVVFGTHLSSAQDATGEADRIAEIKKIRTVIETVTANYNGHVILMGDFNSYVGSSAYNSIETQTGLTNVIKTLASAMKTVDYVFLDDTMSSENIILNYNNQTEFASDHRPVICDVKLK